MHKLVPERFEIPNKQQAMGFLNSLFAPIDPDVVKLGVQLREVHLELENRIWNLRVVCLDTAQPPFFLKSSLQMRLYFFKKPLALARQRPRT